MMRLQLLLFFAATVTTVYCQNPSFTPLGQVGKPPPTKLRKGTRPIRPAPPAAPVAPPVQYKPFAPVPPAGGPPPPAPVAPAFPPAGGPPPPAAPVAPPAGGLPPPAPVAPAVPPAAVPSTRTVSRLGRPGVKRTFAPPRALAGPPPAPVPAVPAPRRGPPPAAFRARQAMPRTKTKSAGFIGSPMGFPQPYFVPTTYPPVPTTFYAPYRYDRPEVKKEEEES